MGISGNIKTMALAELLQWLSQGQKIGTLVIDNGRVEKRVFFKNGLIISSASTDPKEYLGHFLVSQGHISEEEVDKAVARQDEEKHLIGKILVDMGAVSEEELHKLLQLKAEESIYDIFTWDEGDFHFLDGELPEKNMIPMGLDVQWIVLEGSRRLDEWNRIRETIPSPLTVPVLVTDLEQLELEDVDRRILSWVDDDRTVEDISHEAKASLFLVSQTIAHHVQEGQLKAVRPRVIEVEVEVEAPAKAASPEDSGYYRVVREDTGQIPMMMAYGSPVPHPQQQPQNYPPMQMAGGGAYPMQQFMQQAPQHPGFASAAPTPQPQQGAATPSQSIDLGGRALHFAPPQDGQAASSQQAAPEQPKSEAQQLLDQAATQLNQGELDIALETYRQARKASGDNPQIEQAVVKGEQEIQQALEREGFKLSAVPKLQCPMEKLTQLNISPQQGFMLTRVNGSYDVQSLLKLSPMPRLDAQVFFWQLSKSGHIAL